MKKIQIKKFSFFEFLSFFYTFLKNYVQKFFNNYKYSENSRFEVTSLWLRPRIKLSTCETEYTFFSFNRFANMADRSFCVCRCSGSCNFHHWDTLFWHVSILEEKNEESAKNSYVYIFRFTIIHLSLFINITNL